MRTNFTAFQLKDPDVAHCEKALRACVHCGFCTSTCPTYVLLGDELDSPRGRIRLIQDMLESGEVPSAVAVKHIDRCLSCLGCATTCPSSVDYMRLIDHARLFVAERYERPFIDRVARTGIAKILPRAWAFRLMLLLGKVARPLEGFLPKQLRSFTAATKGTQIAWASPRNVYSAQGERKKRVALLAGCVQDVLAPQINRATISLLTRLGVEVVVPRGSGCCGAIAHHLGRKKEGLAFARKNIEAWSRELKGEGLDYLIINASGCGTMVKDYVHLLRGDKLADSAKKLSSMTRDITELLTELGYQPTEKVPALRIAYHPPCSLQHGQKIVGLGEGLLKTAGFEVRDIPEGHLCCGAAGTYNLLEPEIAGRLRERKAKHVTHTRAHALASGNLGCLQHLAGALDVPVVHTVELLDWAAGGERPRSLPAGRTG
jgi:glycolate oxidase iron-sulfur subunit